eukprot:TRINITY_DN8202_c2_g1_i1.p1 TRINITY_DN8202_c2_g1~~TRINITY_DN8202_c2_g1_i1.p1  ORF type:complete len:135 (+),score=15.03 TRINITY_DN8202_c2_g1_i1:339-743(+)
MLQTTTLTVNPICRQRPNVPMSQPQSRHIYSSQDPKMLNQDIITIQISPAMQQLRRRWFMLSRSQKPEGTHSKQFFACPKTIHGQNPIPENDPAERHQFQHHFQQTQMDQRWSKTITCPPTPWNEYKFSTTIKP